MGRTERLFLASSLALIICWKHSEATPHGSRPLMIPSPEELVRRSVVWQWVVPEGSWTSPCVLVEKRLLCPVMRRVPGGIASTLVALDPQSGRVQWQAELQGGSVESWNLAVFGNAVAVAGTGNHLFAFSLKDGSLLWKKELDHAEVSQVSGGALVHQLATSEAPGKLVVLDPFSGAVRSSRPPEDVYNWLEPYDGDLLVVCFGFEDEVFPPLLPPVLPFVVRLKGEDLHTLWRLVLPNLKNAVVLSSAIWVYLAEQDQGTWYELQRDGKLMPLPELANWEGSLLWARGEYQLWWRNEGTQLCRWRFKTNSWAWCRDLPGGTWLAQELDDDRVALAGSTDRTDLLLVVNDEGEVVFQTRGVPEPQAFFPFQGQWLLQQEDRLLLARVDTEPPVASEDVKAQASRLLEEAAEIPLNWGLAATRVEHLVKALLALGPEIKPVLQARLVTFGPVGFAAATAVLMRWGDETAAANLIHWLDEGVRPELAQEEMDHQWALDVASVAVQSVGCDAQAVGALARLMETRNVPWPLRFSAFSSLAQFGSPQALESARRQLRGHAHTTGAPWFQPSTPNLFEHKIWRWPWNARELVLFEEEDTEPFRGLWLAVLENGRLTGSWFTGLANLDEARHELSFEPFAQDFRISVRRKAVTGAEVVLPPEAREVGAVTWAEIQHDQDGDGLTDLLETRLGLAHDRADSDGDGIPDGTDWCPSCGQAPTGPEDHAAKALLFQFARFFEEKQENSDPLRVIWERPLEFSHSGRPVLVLVKNKREQEQLLLSEEGAELFGATWLQAVDPNNLPARWPADLLPDPGQVALTVEHGYLGIAAIVGQGADGAWYVVGWRLITSGC